MLFIMRFIVSRASSVRPNTSPILGGLASPVRFLSPRSFSASLGFRKESGGGSSYLLSIPNSKFPVDSISPIILSKRVLREDYLNRIINYLLVIHQTLL